MWRGILIRFVLDAVIDLFLNVLRERAARTDSDVDDRIVDILINERREIKSGMRQKL